MKKKLRKIRVVTLGCSKNTVDTEHLLAQLPSDEWEVVSEGRTDVLLLNTCGFIGDAKQESIDAILEAVEMKNRGEAGSIGVFGCLSQRYSSELPAEIPEVDAWFGARELAPLLEWLGAKPDVSRSLDRKPNPDAPGSAYLKISEGCDRRCSYCAIPFIRGVHRSVPMEVLEEEARNLASKGVKELILIAQDTTFYGLDLYGRRAVAELAERLSAIEGIEWIRIHYSYPADFPEDLLDAMASNPKICSYMDIPLQHISDTVLDKMHRNIDGKKTRELIAKMRKRVPGVALRTTMICGHPGEGEKEFSELLDFVKEARFERLGAFAYSEEEGTWGAEHLEDSVPEDVKRSRLDELMRVQSEISLEFNRSRVGTTEKILVDYCQDGYLIGRSRFESPEVDGEIRVKLPEWDEAAKYVGQFVTAVITAADVYDLEAEIIYPELAIDLDKVISSKMKGRSLPHFVVKALKRLLHIDELNKLIVKGYRGREFFDRTMEFLDIKVEMKGLEDFRPEPGVKYTFASNHPLGGIDGVILASAISRMFPERQVLIQVNDFLMNLPGMASQSVPVSKTGAQSRSLPEQIEALYASDNPILVFPAGLCSRKTKGVIADLDWKKTFIQKSVQYGRTVIPIHFLGQNSRRFYRVANLCKLMKAKFNFAMAFLPDEMMRGRHKTYKAVMGEPCGPETFDNTRKPIEWAAWMRSQVYKLK